VVHDDEQTVDAARQKSGFDGWSFGTYAVRTLEPAGRTIVVSVEGFDPGVEIFGDRDRLASLGREGGDVGGSFGIDGVDGFFDLLEKDGVDFCGRRRREALYLRFRVFLLVWVVEE